MAARKTFHLSAYTVMHFIVDLSCIFYLAGMINMQLPLYEQWVLAAVLYNMFAFALPMLLGFLADLAGRNALTSCIGCILIMLAYLVIPGPWTAVALIGIGNGLFHIGGGRQILQDADGAYAPSGIFIASGALGVFLGRRMAGAFRQVFFVSLWIVLALCAAVLLLTAIRERTRNVRSLPSAQKVGAGMLLMSLMVFVVVIIRSYYGFAAVYTWNNHFLIGLIFTLCVVAGKACGGIAADKLGVKAASVISLGGAGITALFAADSPVLGCLSILLFNMTMPITLTILAELWKELPGLAFGTLMMALFLGTLPDMLWHVNWLSSPPGLCILCMISLVLLWLVTVLQQRSSLRKA